MRTRSMRTPPLRNPMLQIPRLQSPTRWSRSRMLRRVPEARTVRRLRPRSCLSWTWLMWTCFLFSCRAWTTELLGGCLGRLNATTIGDLLATELVPGDREPDDDADDDVLDVDVDVQQDGPVADQLDQESADDGAGNPALSAEQARPADHRGGDGIEFEADTEVRLAGGHAGGGDDTAESRQHTLGDIHHHQVAAHGDADQP